VTSDLERPHRRYNPLLDEWVLCSPHRLARPWHGHLEPPGGPRPPAYDPDCSLCPGNPRAGGAQNPPYTSTFAFDNDFPALRREARPAGPDAPGLLLARPAGGVCRVLCFSPRHDLHLAGMEHQEVRAVVEAWAEEWRALGRTPAIRHVQVFENRGALMGASNPHPHCQIWATDYVPQIPLRKLATQRSYHARHGSDLLGDYLESELRAGERVVTRNAEWVVLVPFWAVWPFETLVLPVRRVPDLAATSAAERDGLADILRRLNARYDDLFDTPFPYSMGWQARPTDDEEHPYWRLHAVYLPPLLRSATVRKFLVGFELTCEPQRDLSPEEAAARLRLASERTDRA
jgi:UDPglucose--hexose-1-phosphate uridylyltransferase